MNYSIAVRENSKIFEKNERRKSSRRTDAIRFLSLSLQTLSLILLILSSNVTSTRHLFKDVFCFKRNISMQFEHQLFASSRTDAEFFRLKLLHETKLIMIAVVSDTSHLLNMHRATNLQRCVAHDLFFKARDISIHFKKRFNWSDLSLDRLNSSRRSLSWSIKRELLMISWHLEISHLVFSSF